jgi:enamine deaminase RidA (YjgF/YER057c/UK114 family)
MHKTCFIYLPETEGNVEEEFTQCLAQIEKTCKSGYTPVKLNFFIDVPDYESLLGTRSVIHKKVTAIFEDICPSFNITCHPPEKPWKVTVEGSFIKSGSVKVAGKKFKEIPYIILETDSCRELWAAGVSSYSFPDDTSKAAENAFDLMMAILDREKMSLNNLVRQWNYIGNILDVTDGFQNYQAFNEVRSEYYGRYRKIKGFPAATGVGMKHGGVILDFCAMDSTGELKIIAESNPHQVNAYEYDQQVLKGSASVGMKIKHPPQFERALLISGPQKPLLFISGTASIIGQETIGRSDVAEQTVVTIENIFKLKDNNRLNQLLGTSYPDVGRFAILRVYIKQQEDFRIVKLICEETFPGVPKTFIEADICRDDLLTEIEAEYLL